MKTVIQCVLIKTIAYLCMAALLIMCSCISTKEYLNNRGVQRYEYHKAQHDSQSGGRGINPFYRNPDVYIFR